MVDYLTSTAAIGIETGHKQHFEHNRTSGTLAADLKLKCGTSDYGKFTSKGIFNEGISQIRLAYVSPSLTADLGGIKLSTSLENKVTYKLNFDGFETNDVINSSRINFGAKYDRIGTSLYYSQKFDYSLYKKEFAHKITAGVNQELGSSGVSLYGEAYLLPESFRGDFSKASYALGISAKLPQSVKYEKLKCRQLRL